MNIVAIVVKGGRKQVQRVSLSDWQEVTLGRSWDSEILVDDPYVDARHAKLAINDSGLLQIEDLSSANGTKINKRKVHGTQVVNVGDSIKLGDSTIQLFDASNDVAPALERSSSHTIVNKLSSRTGLFLTTTLALVLTLLLVFFGSAEEASAGNIVSQIVGTTVILAGWSLVAGAVGMLFKGETRMLTHWSAACLFLTVILASEFMLEVLKFNVESNSFTQAFEMGLFVIMLVTVCALFFSLCTNLSKVKVRLVSCGLAALAVLAALVPPHLEQEHEKWTAWVNSDVRNLPVMFLLTDPATFESHLEATADLFTALENELAEQPASDPRVAEPLASIQRAVAE